MNIALIFAGGVGSRMGNTVLPKQFLEIDNKPIIIHTLEKFEQCAQIHAISIACKEEYIPLLKTLLDKFHINKVRWIVPGGKTGQLSIYRGLDAIYQDRMVPRDAIILVHDGVRPNITESLIEKNIDMVLQKGNSITVSPAIETVLYTEKYGKIKEVMKRDNVYNAKAPQCFLLEPFYQVHKKAVEDNDVENWDSCCLMYKYGYEPNFVFGESSNIKITTMEDLYVFQAMYQLKQEEKKSYIKKKESGI